jgi:DNA-binding response OmpR family regulator
MDEPAPKDSRPVVLAVEPDASLSSLISSALSREGHSVLVAATAQEAIALSMKSARIDLLVTEVHLPGASGIDLANCIAGIHAGVRVLYLSTLAEEALRRQGIRDSAGVLAKPVALSDLITEVNQILGT